MPDPMYIMESSEDVGESRMILQGCVYRGSGSDAGRPTISHHFQRGGGYDSAILGFSDGGGCRRVGQERKIGQT